MNENIYSQFVNSNQLYNVRSVKIQACITLLERIKHSKIAGTDYLISIYSAQQLISYRFNSKMVSELALSKAHKKKAKIALPKILFDNFRSFSFNISKLSIVINFLFDLVLIARSLILAGLNILTVSSNKLSDIIEEKKREGYTIVVLNPSFPKGDIFSEETEFNFINWHKKRMINKVCYIHFDKNYKLDEILYRDGKVLITYAAKLKFDINFFKKIQLYKNCIITLIRSGRKIPGRFISILKIIDQVITSEQIKLTPLKKLPDIIIFSDSNGILKPYWVNALQEKNIKVQYYFFSSYDSPSIVIDEDPRIDFWKLNTWPEIYCVDNYQATFINSHKVSRDQKVLIAGFPDFTDYPIQFDNLDSRFRMLVFDYEPKIGHFGYNSTNDCGYYTYESNQLFINLLYELAKELNIVMMHKPKRLLSDSQWDSTYLKYIKSLDQNFYRSIDSRVAPRKIIDVSDIVISKPITSTGFIAKEALKESLYFDPIGKISKKDPALRNVQLFNDISILKQYIEIQILTKMSDL